MKKKQADYVLICVVLGLTVFGLVILSSASVVLSQDLFGENYYFLKHQLAHGFILGLALFFICQRIKYEWWQKAALPLLIGSMLLLAAVFIPGIGISHGGAKRWLDLKFISIQPFELVKLPLILYLSALLSKKGDLNRIIKNALAPVSVAVGGIGLMLFFQPNMSALVIVLLIVFLMCFLAGVRLSRLAGAAGLAFAAFFALIKINGYPMKRLTVFLHPETDPLGIGYQINQALLAIGSGGLFGLGIVQSIQKWKYLPEVIGDSIFAIIAEELGFVGVIMVVGAFVVLAWRGLCIAKNAPNKFGYLAAGGISGWLFCQAFINIAAISGLLPLTGMPLPFISYGGSALATALASAGILVNISKRGK